MIEIDEITLAYLQINNPILACDFSDFHNAVEKVLERPVWTHEFATKNRQLKKEINQKFKDHCKRQVTKGDKCIE